MKLYKTILICLTAFSVLLCTSCSDWLNIEPENDLIEQEYWKSKSDVESTLIGAYNSFTKCVNSCFLWGELRADMLTPTLKTSSSYLQVMSNIIVENSSLISWAAFYKAINNANVVIANAEKVLDVDMSFTREQCDAFLAEAYYIRSLSYFYLVRAFKEVPFITSPSKDDGQDYDVPKSSELDILNQLIDDLETYKDKALLNYSTLERTKGRTTKAAMYALLADIYLWRGSIMEGEGQNGQKDYSKCIEACQTIATLSYSLVDRENWFTNFYPGKTTETIFEVQFDRNMGVTNSLLSYFSSSLNYQFIVSPALIPMYDNNQLDIRASGTTYIEQENGESEVWKYVGVAPTTSPKNNRRPNDWKDNNFIIYRLAEIYLIEAEARLLIDPLDPVAENLIRTVKERASIQPNEWVANLYEVLNERQMELAYEGKRWFDLLRFARRSEEGKEAIKNILLTSVSATDRPFFEAKYNDINSFYFPIHINELRENKNLKQNPFYIN